MLSAVGHWKVGVLQPPMNPGFLSPYACNIWGLTNCKRVLGGLGFRVLGVVVKIMVPFGVP